MVTISPHIGKVSVLTLSPESPSSVLVLAHGAGAGMDHPFMSSMAEELRDLKIATLRYNFPFSENKKKRPDVPAVAEKTVHEIIVHAHEVFPKVPLFAGGKSFGGRMTSQLLSKNEMSFVKGLVFFGFPLHAPGKPSIDRGSHLKDVKVPMLFLQGTRDALAEWSLIEKVTSGLPKATLQKIDGGDHGFRQGKSYRTKELAAAAASWMGDRR